MAYTEQCGLGQIVPLCRRDERHFKSLRQSYCWQVLEGNVGLVQQRRRQRPVRFFRPAGWQRQFDGFFIDVGYYGSWWSASEYDSTSAYYRDMDYYNEYANWDYGDWWSASEDTSGSAYSRGVDYLIENAYWGSIDKGNLLSVRCVQD